MSLLPDATPSRRRHLVRESFIVAKVSTTVDVYAYVTRSRVWTVMRRENGAGHERLHYGLASADVLVALHQTARDTIRLGLGVGR